MLTPSQYDHLCDQLAELYAQLDESIIEDMTRRMMRMDYASDATKWQVQQLQESGMLFQDVLSEIAGRSGQTSEHVKRLFESAGIQSIRNDNVRYREANIYTHRTMSDAALQVLNAGYLKCQGNLSNLTLTTAVSAQQSFIQASNLAYMQVTSGTMDYNTAIRRAVQQAAQNGASVLYPSGHVDKLDVAVRRAVLTGVGQTVRQLSVVNANDMGCDLMEITAHAGARPSHAEWQGKIVSLSGRRGYLSPDDIGYGTVDGFGGANCRHDWYPFFEGISTRAYSDDDLKRLNEPNIKIGDKLYTDYEVSQMQRARERKIREKKRQVIAAKVMIDSAQSDAEEAAAQDEFRKKSVQLKRAEQKLRDFLNQTGFLDDSARVWVNGFDRSISQKAVWANRKAQAAKNPLPSSSGSSGALPSAPKNSGSGSNQNLGKGSGNSKKNSLTNSGGNGTISIASNAHPRNLELEKIIKKCIEQDKPVFADDLAKYFPKIPPEKGRYIMSLHGTPNSAFLYGQKIDARTLANIIRSRKDYNGTDEIVLISCNTGNEENVKKCFAQKLSDELGVTVYAPTKYGAINVFGKYYSSNSLGTKRMGEFKKFTPKKQEEKK